VTASLPDATSIYTKTKAFGWLEFFGEIKFLNATLLL
jgi:hypothetical protein